MASSNEDIFRRAMTSFQAGRLNDAEREFKNLLRDQPRHIAGLNILGIILTSLKRYSEAEHYLQSALALNSLSDATFYNYGIVLKALQRPTEAMERFSQALAINDSVAETWNNRGTVLNDLKRHRDAIDDFDKAISLRPAYAEAFCNKGKSLAELKSYHEAFAAFDKALALRPDLAVAWLGRGNVFSALKRYDEAFAAYDEALAHQQDLNGAEGARLHAKMQNCNWVDLEADFSHLISTVTSGAASTDPFSFLAVPSSSADQLQCATLWVAANYPRFENTIWQGQRYDHKRIRVAYLSGDFHQHAVSYLAAGMFECHDKSRFEMTAISYGSDDGSEFRQRLKAAFERFIDARVLGDDHVAGLVRELEIDILVDLKGFTGDARTGILARRCAPVQVNYLGYPGTMGTKYVDYIVADRIVIPEHKKNSYSENIVFLPDSYQINDDKRSISDRALTRTEAGLPPAGFVFCCFNNSYKITPHVFDCWMRILERVEGSLLWLLEDNATAASNLKREAAARGLNPERLIFAKRMPLPEHLARHRLADLFIDTLPYNAHTTASDALWAGLPVLTRLGETFAGRVAASLLNAIHLPELITTSPAAYEELAIELATHPEKLARIRRKLADNRLTTPLFDTKHFTRHIEAAYAAMHERHQAGLAPDHISVPNS